MSDPTLVERLAESIQVHANAKHVYGEPVERNGSTIIPVARVQWGFGGGGFGRGPGERSGGGGGVQASPSGFIELKAGQAEFRPIHDPGRIAAMSAAAAVGVIAGLVLAKLLRR